MSLVELEQQYGLDLKIIRWQDFQQWRPLLDEISKLKETLLKLDTDDTDPTDYFVAHLQRIQGSIASVPVLQYVAPIHQLLRVGPLKRIAIPLDILALLTSAGFNVNFQRHRATCLDLGIAYNHFKAAKWLVEHDANYESISTIYSMLERKPNVPLDLFDLLMTPENLNRKVYCPPLHQALQDHHTDYALQLMQLGAKIDLNNQRFNIPLDYYFDTYQDHFHEELFLKLIPPDCKILVCAVNTIVNDKRYKFEVMSEMVRYLLQYLTISKRDEISFGREYTVLKVSPEELYMDSVMALLLDMNTFYKPNIEEMMPMPNESCKQALEDIWNAHNHRHRKVKFLVTLCIHSVRNSMSSLDKNSFHSLPVPSRIRNLLMLRNVAGILCEAWRIWPKCLSIEDIVNEAL